MAIKKETEKKVEDKRTQYIVLENFTEVGKTRGYVKGETFPRPDDIIGEGKIEKLLGKNANGIVYIKEK